MRQPPEGGPEAGLSRVEDEQDQPYFTPSFRKYKRSRINLLAGLGFQDGYGLFQTAIPDQVSGNLHPA